MICPNSRALRRPAVLALTLAGSAVVQPATLAAQASGAIKGVVSAAETRTPISGACVALNQSGCLAITDGRGSYVLRGVSAGNDTVIVTAIGRKPSRHPVTVAGGRTEMLDVVLEQGPLMLSSLIVTATRLPTEASKVAGTVNVLTPEQIATSPARETQDLLREIPGVELPRTSSLVGGSAQIVSIRGVDEGRTVVLFDGIPVGDAWGEWIDWGRVPKGMLDRVEVVEGGTSNLYGNGAIGGVISFFSRPMAPGAGTITLDAGSRDVRHGYAAVGVPLARGLTANVNGDYLEGGGYTMLDPLKRGAIDVPSEINQRNGYVRLNYSPASRISAFVTGHLFGDTRHLGTPLGLTTRHQRNADVGLNYGTDSRSTLSLRGWYGTQDEHQRTTSVRANSATCGGGSTAPRACEDSSVVADIPSRDYGASLVWTRKGWLGLESFTVGGDYRHMNGSFEEVDFNTSCPGASCGSVVRSISSGGDQDLSGAFVQGIAAPTARLRLELGARIDRWTNSNGRSVDPIAGTTEYPNRSKTAFSPRVGARYELARTFSLHGAAYQAFRAPNLAELYRKQINANASQITLPNPDLKPESGRGWEAGFDWQPAPWVQLRGTGYIADYKDFNVPTQISAGPPVIRQRLNIAKSRSKGGEVYLALRPVEPLFISASVNYDNARVVSNDASNGNRINRVPSPKHTLRATYTSRMLGTWTGIYRYEGHTTTLQGATLERFHVFDANVQRELGYGVSGFVSLENIGNSQYQVNRSGTGANTLISYGLPRTLRIGATWSR